MPVAGAPRTEVFETVVLSRIYVLLVCLAFPIAAALAILLRPFFRPRSVAHLGEMRHIQHQFVSELRRAGIDATYVGLGDNPYWQKADVRIRHIANPVAALARDMRVLFGTVARHEVIHSHCLMGISHYQWEFLLLRLMGRRIVGHIRGCEGRTPITDKAVSRNICAACDYLPHPLCLYRENRRRRAITAKLAQSLIVTTPDLRDFWPKARHIPFFLPSTPEGRLQTPTWNREIGRPLRVVHVTNQPGIEGTATIEACIERMIKAGQPIEFRHVAGVSHAEVMAAYANADLAIGKMKMGYYANAQVESMLLGIPTITWVRPDLLTDDIVNAGFIISSLDELEVTLETILDKPDILSRAAAKARDGIVALHDPTVIIRNLEEIYGWR